MNVKRGLIFYVAATVLLMAGNVLAQVTPTPIQNDLLLILRADLPQEVSVRAADVDAAVEALEIRLDSVNGATVTSGQDEQGVFFEVRIPPVADASVTIDMLLRPGLMELVDFSGLEPSAEWEGHIILTSAQVERENRFAAPEATPEAYPPDMLNPLTEQPFKTVLTSADLLDAQAQVSQFGDSWDVIFEVSPEGAEKLGVFTEEHIGDVLAIVLDGEVISTPIIQGRLEAGGVISGNFTQEEAVALAQVLRSGALSLPLVIESADTVRD